MRGQTIEAEERAWRISRFRVPMTRRSERGRGEDGSREEVERKISDAGCVEHFSTGADTLGEGTSNDGMGNREAETKRLREEKKRPEARVVMRGAATGQGLSSPYVGLTTGLAANQVVLVPVLRGRPLAQAWHAHRAWPARARRPACRAGPGPCFRVTGSGLHDSVARFRHIHTYDFINCIYKLHLYSYLVFS